MAASKTESPADKVKRELAEREARNAEAAKAAAAQSTTNTLTAEEQAAIDAAEEADQGKDLQSKLRAAEARIAELESKPEEDPEVVAERKRRFERAEAFEREMALKRQRVVPAQQDPAEVAQGDTMTVTVPTAAFDVIHRMALALPLSTPPEHVMCGYGGIRITVGIIRALAGVKMR